MLVQFQYYQDFLYHLKCHQMDYVYISKIKWVGFIEFNMIRMLIMCLLASSALYFKIISALLYWSSCRPTNMMSEVFMQIFCSISLWSDITSLCHQNTSLLIIHFSTFLLFEHIFLFILFEHQLSFFRFILILTPASVFTFFIFILERGNNCSLKVSLTPIQAAGILQWAPGTTLGHSRWG